MIMKRILKELFGTALLVLIACGIASTSNIILATSVTLPGAFSLLTIAIAGGLSYYVTSYIFNTDKERNAFNPILTVTDILNHRVTLATGIKIILSQLAGGILGTEILGIILGGKYGAMGANGYGELSIIGSSVFQAFAIEFITSLILCLVYQKIDKLNNQFIIPLTITVIYLMAIPYTNGGANPAKSFGTSIMMGTAYIKQLWLFVIAPICGAIISYFLAKLLQKK